MACTECKVDYPERLTSDLFTTKKIYESVCGICALEIVNKMHEIERKSFDAPVAERMRQDALKWRKEHGYHQ